METKLTLGFLKDLLQDQWNILVDLNISINNVKRLIEDKYEFDEKVKNHGFFQHHWYQLKFIMVIQLCKLLGPSNNEKRSLWKLSNYLENSNYDLEFRQKLKDNLAKDTSNYRSKQQIKEHCKMVRLRLETENELIEKIVAARDQIYAHKDVNPQVKAIQMNELAKLIDISVEIHNEFFFRLFNKTGRFDLTNGWSIDYPLWYISEYRKIDRDRLENEVRGASS